MLFSAKLYVSERFRTERRNDTMRGRKARPQTTTTKRTIAYVRVSTEDQAEAGVSLAAQRARIEAFCVATARELDETIVDAGQSAKSLVRPGMTRILEGVRNGTIGTVVVLKLDRLTRSVRDLGDLTETFTKADASLVSVGESLDTSSAAGRMVTNLLAVVAQWEREAIAERTAFALSHKRSQGKAYSPTPFGFERVEDRIVQHEDGKRGLDLIRRMNAAGASLRQIANALTAAGIAPTRGGSWYASSVKSILGSRMFLEAA